MAPRVVCRRVNMVKLKRTRKRCVKCMVKNPTFNYVGETRPLRCSGCKEERMVNIRRKRCAECHAKDALYNVPSEKTAKYCCDCRTADMICVKNRCVQCKVTVATYNTIDARVARYCRRCKTPDMIHLRKRCTLCKSRQRTIDLATNTQHSCCDPCHQIVTTLCALQDATE